MKRINALQRLPRILFGITLASLVALSWLVLPVSSAQAATRYHFDWSLSENLHFNNTSYQGEKQELTKKYNTEDSQEICEALTAERKQEIKNLHPEVDGYNLQLDGCHFEGNRFFLRHSGYYDEETLKQSSSDKSLKLTGDDTLVLTIDNPTWDSHNLDTSLGIAHYTFPGKIKSVTPDIGEISGNTWILEKPLTADQKKQIEDNKGVVFTAARHPLEPGVSLGFAIPAVLFIVASVGILVLATAPKKKLQNPGNYLPGYGGYYPQAAMPGYFPQTPPGGYMSPSPYAPYSPQQVYPVPNATQSGLPINVANPQMGQQFGGFTSTQAPSSPQINNGQHLGYASPNTQLISNYDPAEVESDFSPSAPSSQEYK